MERTIIVRKILSVILACAVFLSVEHMSVFAEDVAKAKIGDVSYESLTSALQNVKDGETIELVPGTHELGDFRLPISLLNVTIKGAEDKSAVIKNSRMLPADDAKINYTGVKIDGIVFASSDAFQIESFRRLLSV